MDITIRGRNYTLTEKDRILDNGRVYILVTQKTSPGYEGYSPNVPKKLFKNLLTEGKIRLSADKYRGAFGGVYDLYELSV